jgi:hypothetical protein
MLLSVKKLHRFLMSRRMSPEETTRAREFSMLILQFIGVLDHMSTM